MTLMETSQALWWARMGSALRTVLACTIVGCATLYSPERMRNLLAFPAFSYVTTVLIVSDATLGDTLRGTWHVLCATLQAMSLSVLSLWVIGPSRFTGIGAAVAVAVSTFLVALPKSTHLMAKRIAFGQIVIVYVGAVVHGAETGVVMHPLHVASSTAVGALASVLAMLFPYPWLAYCEIKKSCKLYAENASERLKLYMEALSARDNAALLDLISQARLLSRAGAKLLQSIKDRREGMKWERPQMRFWRLNRLDRGGKLQEMEIQLGGMELALACCRSFPVGMIDQEIRHVLQSLKAQISIKLEQAKCSMPFDATTAPETKGGYAYKPPWNLKPCLHQLKICQLSSSGIAWNSSTMTHPSLEIVSAMDQRLTLRKSDSQNEGNGGVRRALGSLFIWRVSKNVVFALKCSLSLGLAVLFGLLYNKENGYWSGLTIAISFVTGRQATFTMANARAQGTVMGSVYGILCCFIFHRLVDFRFLLLFPWIIFTTFLMHSRMYGQAGGISALVGALLILGRKNYGTPSDFVIARIAEATIGLLRFISVEILFNRSRAATLAKTELSRCLEALQDCIKSIAFCTGENDGSASILMALRKKQKKLQSHVHQLGNFVAEAEVEPNFCFPSFHDARYQRLLGSLAKVANVILFLGDIIGFLSQLWPKFEYAWKEVEECMITDLQHHKVKVDYSLKCLKEVISIKSFELLEKDLQKRNIPNNIEFGQTRDGHTYARLDPDENDIEEIVNSFLQHLKEAVSKSNTNDDEKMLKSHMILRLGALGFCISSLMGEAIEIEKNIKELVKLENPTRNIDLYEISCKLKLLYSK